MSKVDDMYKDSEKEMKASVASLTAPKKRREKLFRDYRDCPKANALDRVGMVIMICCFAAIVIATVMALAHVNAEVSGIMLFIATYLGMVGYGLTSHASKIYIDKIRKDIEAKRKAGQQTAGNGLQ